MKMKTTWFLFSVVILSICVQFTGCQSLKKTSPPERTVPVVQEGWQAISNRWSSAPLEKITQAAEQGDVAAQYYLAVAYFNRNRAAKDPNETLKWVKLAAQQGVALAQRDLGQMFQDGLGTATNIDEAVTWYQKAAQQGDGQAQVNLGWMYENGVGVSQDYAQAAQFFHLAAEQGNALGQSNLGWLYKNGLGVSEDAAEAFKWYQKAAEQNEVYAEENLASMYAEGFYGTNQITDYGSGAQVRSGGMAPDHVWAEKWMQQAIDLNTAEGQYKLGNLIHNEMDKDGHQQDTTRFPDAAAWLKKAAAQGYAKAQYELAEMYNTGELGDDQRSNCIPWFLKAAAQGNAEAQAEVGELPQLYPNNELLNSVNNIEALRQSGEQGNLNAQYQLAKRYQFGVGVPKDPVEAFKWMQKAANNDTASSLIGDAIYCLAVMYEKGEGVTQDITQAHNLYLEAVSPVFFQPQATFRVGQMYEKGEGVPQDDHEAAQLYSAAMCNTNSPDVYPNGLIEHMSIGDGSLEALFNLWSQGRGFPGEETNKPGYLAPNILIKGWNGLIVTAKTEFYVGQIYYQGKLVPQDLVEAAARFHVAADQNLDNAQKMFDQVELQLSPAQKEAAKTRSDNLEKAFKQAISNAENLKAGMDFMPWAYPGH